MDKLLECQEEKDKLQYENYDLLAQLEEMSEEVEYAESHDILTGVFNNAALVDKLKTNQNQIYILLNVDNFKNINSAYGYEVGNETLKEIVKLLNIIKIQDFTIYRFCSDKFVLLSDQKRERYELNEMIESLLSFFNTHELLIDDDIPIYLSFSIGVSTAIGISAIVQAELAVEEIRKSRRNYFYVYDQELEDLERQQESVYWIEEIRNSILEEAVIVHYQPILNNHTNSIEKYECLSRIDHEGDMVSPFRFMDAAKQTKVLHLMTQSVITQAFKKFSKTECEFSINITKDDLFIGYLEEFLLKHCAKSNIVPSRVVLEILEDINSLNEKDILDQLESLRMNGFKIAIDDFGAENSNFSRLLEFRPDYLKIDGAFVKNIISDENSRLITESIVSICKKSGIKVIAEYIHDQEVLDFITKIGIDYSQGFHIGAPSTELL